MDSFVVKGIAANVVSGAVFLGCIFVSAGTVHYWQAWAFFFAFEAAGQGLGVYFLVRDREVLERRMRVGPMAEKEPAQKIISALFLLGFLAMLIVPALDHRFGWSVVPSAVSILGDLLVVAALLSNIPVLKANRFAGSTVRVEAGQPVVSTGPYAHVRHPMYATVIALLIGIPLALGSWFGLLGLIPFLLVLVWRILDEERFLRQNLPGYTEYMHAVHYRLLPRIW